MPDPDPHASTDRISAPTPPADSAARVEWVLEQLRIQQEARHRHVNNLAAAISTQDVNLRDLEKDLDKRIDALLVSVEKMNVKVNMHDRIVIGTAAAIGLAVLGAIGGAVAWAWAHMGGTK